METLLRERNQCLSYFITEQIKSLCGQPDTVAELIADFTIRKYDSTISTAVDGHGQWHTLYIFRYDGRYAALQFNHSNKIEKTWIDSINRIWAKKTEFCGFDIISCTIIINKDDIFGLQMMHQQVIINIIINDMDILKLLKVHLIVMIYHGIKN